MSQIKTATPGLIRGVFTFAVPTVPANSSVRGSYTFPGVTKEHLILVAPVVALTAGYEAIRANCTTDGTLMISFANFTGTQIVGGNVSFKVLVL